MPPPVVDSQGRAIAPAAAARRESVTSQTKLARERAARVRAATPRATHLGGSIPLEEPEGRFFSFLFFFLAIGRS
jgi:hypothetical protein